MVLLSSDASLGAAIAENLNPVGTSTSTNVRLTEAEIHAVSTACRYHCGFPQVRIVCQQIRGHSVHNLMEWCGRAPALRANDAWMGDQTEEHRYVQQGSSPAQLGSSSYRAASSINVGRAPSVTVRARVSDFPWRHHCRRPTTAACLTPLASRPYADRLVKSPRKARGPSASWSDNPSAQCSYTDRRG
jgi:hypothetical protein